MPAPSLFPDPSDSGNATRVSTRMHADGMQSARADSTPNEDRKGIEVLICPRKVIPIIFLPGIMGTHLSMTPERQQELGRSNNIAWRPEASGEAVAMMFKDPAERQQMLDPETTSVDRYDPQDGDDINERHRGNVKKIIYVSGNDNANAGDASERARLRGWSEVYFDSYGKLLQTLEASLNNMCDVGEPSMRWTQGATHALAVEPRQWGGDGGSALTREELKKISDAWYPVHAVGYNWLKSNGDSGKYVAQRIKEIKKSYLDMKYDCRKVIVVTHSMGGLVGRALIHGSYGNAEELVAGIVHGAMPAIGAAAAYKRMRMGFEGGPLIRRVLGDTGPKVTAVLANAPGGLELLPSERYAPGWLRVETDSTAKGELLRLPKSDPYSEIYTVQDKWYRLINPEWVNPANSPTSDLEKTIKKLYQAQEFHNDIATTYHRLTYLSYGADKRNKDHRAWGTVTWKMGGRPSSQHPVEQWKTYSDAGDGTVALTNGVDPNILFGATISDPTDAGDGTVPAQHSAEDPVRQGKVKVSFRDIGHDRQDIYKDGYDHQGSYKDDAVIASTLYSIAKIAHDAFDWWEAC